MRFRRVFRALILTSLLVLPSTAIVGQRTPAGPTYKVVGVPVGDHLNLRDAPHVGGTVLQEIPRDAEGILGTGRAIRLDAQVWFEVSYAGKTGWVNARYLMDAEGKALAATAFLGTVTPRKINESCERKNDNMQQLICEAASHAPRLGKRVPEGRMFFDDLESYEPSEHCYQLITPRRLSCFSDRYGNDTCAIAIEEEYNCGASGGSMLIYKCVKAKHNGRILCRIDDATADGLGSGMADLAKMAEAMETPAFTNLTGMEQKYVAHAGSYQNEMEAYRRGRDAFQKIDEPWRVIKPTVTKVYVSQKIWYRLLLTLPTEKEVAAKTCDIYRERTGNDCYPATTTLYKLHFEPPP
jgi:hypothetical protein